MYMYCSDLLLLEMHLSISLGIFQRTEIAYKYNFIIFIHNSQMP